MPPKRGRHIILNPLQAKINTVVLNLISKKIMMLYLSVSSPNDKVCYQAAIKQLRFI